MTTTTAQFRDIRIAYIGGGSRGWAWKLMSDLALEPALSGTVSLYDIDHPAALANETIGNSLSGRPALPGSWRYRAVSSLGEALKGADIIVLSILPGTFEDMAVDVHMPESYGIYQSVGDTTGPGGLFRALRTIPMYETIGRAIGEHAPRAWVINYTNPMALCVRTLYTVFPEIKAFGCCHEVFGTRRLLAAIAREECGLAGASMAEVEVNVLGINHFTWIDSASCRGQNLMPAWAEFCEKHHESGALACAEGDWTTDWFSSGERVKIDLFRRYGLIAAAGDRHLAEFMPPWYLADPDTVRAWMFSLTPVSWRLQNAAALKAKSARLVSGEERFEPAPSGEEGVRQILALLGGGSMVTNLNAPNRGQVGNLPPGSIVETNAFISLDSVRPVLAGNLPSAISGLTARHVANQETILQAALARDLEAALPAFLNDPLVTIPPSQAEKLFAAMAGGMARHFKGWKTGR